MAEQGPELNESRAKGGTRGPNRVVLIVSLILVIIAFAAIYATRG